MGTGVRLCRGLSGAWLDYLEHGGWRGQWYHIGKDGMNKERQYIGIYKIACVTTNITATR